MATPSPSSGLNSARATDDSSSSVITLTTAAMTSLGKRVAMCRRAHAAAPGPSSRSFSAGDRQRIEVAVDATIARAFERGA